MRAALEVARRELKDNVATWKLTLALALTTLMLLAGVMSLAVAHRDAQDAHELVQDDYLAREEDGTAAALAHRFLGRPNALALVVGGPAESVRASVAAAPVVANESARAQDPVRLRFEPTDLERIAVGALSLVAVLVSYDAISGEKERGTLKILLLNPLSRAEVLLGKYLGAMATVLLPLAGALLLAVPALLWAGIRLSTGEWARLGVILLVLVLFLSAIVLLALAVSALTTRTSVSILALVMLWLVLVAAAGSVAVFVATAEPEGIAADELLREMRLLHASYDEEERAAREELARLQAKNATQNGTLAPEDAARLRGLQALLAELAADRAEDQQRLLSRHLDGRALDHRQAERVAAISPAEAFRSAAQRVARTDYESARERLDEFSAYLREVADLEAEARARNATFEPPAFRSRDAFLSGDVERAAPFLAALVAQNATALVVALVGFARYDVR